MTAAPWIAGREEHAVGASLDRGDTAEEEVAARPWIHGVTRLLELLRCRLRPSPLDLDDTGSRDSHLN